MSKTTSHRRMVPVNVFFWGGGGWGRGHTNFCSFCPNYESMPESLPALNISLSGGGGGGGGGAKGDS